jgi:eukaryotic-like serine/threonine-protein kinase
VSGEEHPETLVVMHNQALMYESEGRYQEAKALFARTLEIRRRVLGEEHPNTLATMASLGLTLLDQNKYAEAEPLLRSALAHREKATPDVWQRFQAQSLVGASLAGQKKYDAAEPLLLSGFEGLLQRETRIPHPERDTLQNAGVWIIRCYQDWGKPEKATAWRQKLTAANVWPAKEH